MAHSKQCRSICTDIAERGKREVEERDRELADQVNTATLKQLQLKFEADLGVLKERVPTKEKEAQEAALDIKYLAQRQKTLVSDLFGFAVQKPRKV